MRSSSSSVENLDTMTTALMWSNGTILMAVRRNTTYVFVCFLLSPAYLSVYLSMWHCSTNPCAPLEQKGKWKAESQETSTPPRKQNKPQTNTLALPTQWKAPPSHLLQVVWCDLPLENPISIVTFTLNVFFWHPLALKAATESPQSTPTSSAGNHLHAFPHLFKHPVGGAIEFGWLHRPCAL